MRRTLEVGPFGPWLKPGQKPPEPAHQQEDLPGGAVLLEDLTDTTEPEWRVGSVIDLFNGVYRVMAQPTKTRRGFSPTEVDEMLVSTVAVLIGAGVDVDAQMRDEVAELAARRRAGTLPERWWEEDTGDS